MDISEKELKDLLEQAAELGAEKAIEKCTTDMYQFVGRKVVSKLWQLVGIVAVSFCIWAVKHGWFSN